MSWGKTSCEPSVVTLPSVALSLASSPGPPPAPVPLAPDAPLAPERLPAVPASPPGGESDPHPIPQDPMPKARI